MTAVMDPLLPDRRFIREITPLAFDSLVLAVLASLAVNPYSSRPALAVAGGTES